MERLVDHINMWVIQDGVVSSLRQGGISLLEYGSPGGFKEGGTLLEPLNTPVYISPKLITNPGALLLGSTGSVEIVTRIINN